jgi:hypothetical protein
LRDSESVNSGHYIRDLNLDSSKLLCGEIVCPPSESTHSKSHGSIENGNKKYKEHTASQSDTNCGVISGSPASQRTNQHYNQEKWHQQQSERRMHGTQDFRARKNSHRIELLAFTPPELNTRLYVCRAVAGFGGAIWDLRKGEDNVLCKKLLTLFSYTYNILG